MRYFSYPSSAGGERLIARDGGQPYDLTSARDELRTFTDLAKTASIVDEDIDRVANRAMEAADVADVDGLTPNMPLLPNEVWAAGVTYKVSEEARREESEMADFYSDVYEAERPEIFFKATPSRTVGPGEAVGVRGDSSWNVPEPELGIVLYNGDIVGYTVGNDVSSRSIEGQNPLYLPQAKVYERCCSIGPSVVSANSIDAADLMIRMTIERDGDVVFEDRVSTARKIRTDEELTEYFRKHNDVPELAVLLTGTNIVPSEDFTLREGDRVSITIDEVGTLENPVVRV